MAGANAFNSNFALPHALNTSLPPHSPLHPQAQQDRLTTIASYVVEHGEQLPALGSSGE